MKCSLKRVARKRSRGVTLFTMHEQDASSTTPSGSQPKKPLDIVVKLALGVLIGSFALIWGGAAVFAYGAWRGSRPELKATELSEPV